MTLLRKGDRAQKQRQQDVFAEIRWVLSPLGASDAAECSLVSEKLIATARKNITIFPASEYHKGSSNDAFFPPNCSLS
jgi:hypothetical protein